jgi:hypothetical protein
MAGEYQVVKSIIEYSLPRLVGWSTFMDHALERSISDSVNNADSGGGGGSGPYGGGSGSGGSSSSSSSSPFSRGGPRGSVPF